MPKIYWVKIKMGAFKKINEKLCVDLNVVQCRISVDILVTT